jgi:methyltransferase-like protein/cyclopropane fatty-acyl-phospholipid synthase-like methyltransferase
MSHPARLAALARLFGLTPVPLEHARVLEIGCVDGGNLLPMAEAYPEAQFVGIDSSSSAIAAGRQVSAALGIKNLALIEQSLLASPQQTGPFDYVLAHGVFPRLQPAQQRELLEMIAGALAINGLAYVSYNVYPGWHTRGMVAEMTRYLLERRTRPEERVPKARAFLHFLAESAVPKDSVYQRLLAAEEQLLSRSSDTVLLHDYLNSANYPLYFHEFDAQARACGLRYVSDTHASTMAPKAFPPETQRVLETIADDRIETEQYLDFLRNRMFRHSILCHQAHEPKYHLELPVVLDFSVASSAQTQVSEVDLRPDVEVAFVDRDGTILTTSAPIAKVAILLAAQVWPQAIPFRTLLDASITRLGQTPDLANRQQQGSTLAHFLLECFTSTNMVELHLYPPTFTMQPSDKPLATPLARYQAQETGAVTNRRHERISLSLAERHTLRLLDGTRDGAALLQAMMDLVEAGVLTAQRDGQPVDDPQERHTIVVETLNQILTQLGRSALLVN